MSSPLSWQLLEAVRTCLTRITPGNGYRTNAGATVELEPGQVRNDQDEFLAVVLEGMSAPLNPALRAIGRAVTVAIIAKVPSDRDNAQLRLHEVIEDVERAMQDQRSRFPQGTDFPKFASVERIPQADGLKWVGAVIRYTAHTRR